MLRAAVSSITLRLGTYSPAPVPAWLIDEARSTPWIWSPSAMARDSRLSTTTPAPSLGTSPFAASSKVRSRPSGDSTFMSSSSRYLLGCRLRLTPPASAMSHSPERMALRARCTAVSDEEQAVLTVRLGPRKFIRNEMRLANSLVTEPGPRYSPRCRDSSDMIQVWSSFIAPT
jgi:hypothetical protein